MSDFPPVFTIGHSTRAIPEFAEICRGARVELVVDVRTVPRSRHNPQYNADAMPGELEQWQIGYDRIAELGGLRSRAHDVPPQVNGLWRNQSFHNYADYALSDTFERGLDALLRMADERPTAIMCSEAVWWRCHRRIIADYLLLRGREVLHLMGGGRITPATLTPGAEAQGSALVYPAESPSENSEPT